MTSQPPPPPAELVRRVVAALCERTLTSALARAVPMTVTAAALPPTKGAGLAVTLCTLDGGRPAVWLVPQPVWTAWSSAWRATLPDPDDSVHDKALLLVLSGGLDAWQRLAGGAEAVPGYPFVSPWDDADGEGWTVVGRRYRWFQIRSAEGLAWLGLEEALATVSGDRLSTEAAFRARVRETVLGEACGRIDAERDWTPSVRGSLRLDSLVFGPCLFADQPEFLSADAGPWPAGELALVHQFGWDGRRFSVCYRAPGSGPEAALGLLARVGRLLPWASLVDREPEGEIWTWGTEPELTGNLRLRAVCSETSWEVFLPAELLNELSSSGCAPWQLRWLSGGGDNLLLVFLSAQQRCLNRPPAGLRRLAGYDWSRTWFGSGLENGPAPFSVADLWAEASPEDRNRLVQNVLTLQPALQPLAGLFVWMELDPAGAVWFHPPGFDSEEFARRLAPEPRREWDAAGRPMQTRDEYEARNEAALRAVWDAWRSGRLLLSPRAATALTVGYAEPRREARHRWARARTGPGWREVLVASAGDRQLGPALQRLGARTLALALLYDSAADLVSTVTSRPFAEEFGQQRRYWKDALAAEGPDPVEFESARRRAESELIPWLTAGGDSGSRGLY